MQCMRKVWGVCRSNCCTVSAHTEPQPEQFIGRSGANVAILCNVEWWLVDSAPQKTITSGPLLWCSTCRNSDMASGRSASGVDDAISSTNLTWSQWCFLCLQVVHFLRVRNTHNSISRICMDATTGGWPNEATTCINQKCMGSY